MRKYILKVLLIISPLLFLFMTFIIFDPFAIINKSGKYTVVSSMNDDAHTFRTFELNNNSMKFNAFVLGNSKSLAILGTDWKKHIGKDESVFKFGSPGESILNIRKKLEYAAKRGNKIKNAIILLDNNILMNTDNLNPDFAGPVYLKHPKGSNNNWLEYIGKGFYYYLYDGFFLTYFSQIYNYRKKQAAENNVNWNIIESVMTKEEFNNLHQSNEFYRWDTEQQILLDSVSWVQALPKIDSGLIVSTQTIDKRDVLHLEEIKRIFNQNQTEYKIVFGPEYGCVKMNDKLIEEFNRIFGKSNVFDFTSYTMLCNQPINFYEPNHYRPKVGRRILEIIYN